MQIYSKLKQYYRYRRNWKKYKSREVKGDTYKNISEQLKFYSEFIKDGDLVFDIGANVGDKTDIFLRLGAKVVAVEPQESCWRILERRFKNEDVSIESVAISNQEGEVELFVDRSTTLSTLSQDWITTVKQSGRFSKHKWAYSMPVKTTTLDTLIKKYGKPEFCKIDVEGFEFNVLRGLSQPVETISFEFVSERSGIALNCIDYLI